MRATTGSRGHGSLKARCSQWWRGATRSYSREARGFLRARAIRAWPALAAVADGVRSDPPLLCPLLPGVGVGARRDGGRVACRDDQLLARRLGGRTAESLRAKGREDRTVEYRRLLACALLDDGDRDLLADPDRKSTRLNSSHQIISYAVFCLKKKI